MAVKVFGFQSSVESRVSTRRLIQRIELDRHGSEDLVDSIHDLSAFCAGSGNVGYAHEPTRPQGFQFEAEFAEPILASGHRRADLGLVDQQAGVHVVDVFKLPDLLRQLLVFKGGGAFVCSDRGLAGGFQTFQRPLRARRGAPPSLGMVFRRRPIVRRSIFVWLARAFIEYVCLVFMELWWSSGLRGCGEICAAM